MFRRDVALDSNIQSSSITCYIKQANNLSKSINEQYKHGLNLVKNLQ